MLVVVFVGLVFDSHDRLLYVFDFRVPFGGWDVFNEWSSRVVLRAVEGSRSEKCQPRAAGSLSRRVYRRAELVASCDNPSQVLAGLQRRHVPQARHTTNGNILTIQRRHVPQAHHQRKYFNNTKASCTSSTPPTEIF
jgi:hypothetical protein